MVKVALESLIDLNQAIVTAVSGTGWTDIVGAIGGIGGLGIGGVSAVIAASAKRVSRASAEASRDSADEAAKTRRIDADLQHDHFQPETPAEIKTDLREGTLFGRIRLPRDYRVAATGIYRDGNQHPIEIFPVLLRGGRDYEFPIEVWPEDRTTPTTEEIRSGSGRQRPMMAYRRGRAAVGNPWRPRIVLPPPWLRRCRTNGQQR